MPSENYKHYRLLSSDDLIGLIEKKDADIINLQEKLKNANEIKGKYIAYNQFHIEEITRLDKIIGNYKKNKQ